MIWLFLFALLIQTARSQEAVIGFEEANRLYRSGDLLQAARTYEELSALGYESPELFYNLGNVYYKLGKIPAAILNYERARRLAPNDEDIAHNLRLARLRIVDRIEPLPQLFVIEWWEAFVDINSADGWAVGATVFLWAAALCGMALLSARSSLFRRITVLLASLFVAACLLCFAAMAQRASEETSREGAIVFAPSVSVKSAPDMQSTDLFALHEGVTVQVLDSVGTWKKIRLADGKIGWLPGTSLETI